MRPTYLRWRCCRPAGPPSSRMAVSRRGFTYDQAPMFFGSSWHHTSSAPPYCAITCVQSVVPHFMHLKKIQTCLVKGLRGLPLYLTAACLSCVIATLPSGGCSLPDSICCSLDREYHYPLTEMGTLII